MPATPPRKKRVLLCNEASYLSTGFGTYGMEVLKRLHATGKYELAELASYGDTSDHNDGRWRELPWAFFPVKPNQYDRGEVEEYNRKVSNQFGEWRFERACLDFKPDCIFDIRDWWMCLVENTPILTIDGVKDVQDVLVGDQVLTHLGRYRSVTHRFPVRVHDGLFVKLTPSYCRLPLTVTEGHPVLVVRRLGQNLPDFATSEPEWVRAEELRKGDILCMPRTRCGGGTITPELARLLGYYAAEGCVMYEGSKARGVLKGVQFTLGLEEWNIVRDIIDLTMKLFDHEVFVSQIRGQNTLVLRVYSSRMASSFSGLVPGLARTKSISSEIFFSPDESVRQFLCGLFRGDGHLRHEPLRATYSTASRSLALQVFQLCVRLGVLPSFFRQKNSCKGKTFYRYLFAFCGEALAGFLACWNGKGEFQPSPRIDSRYAYLTLDKVEQSCDKREVYNFEVAQDNSYVSSFALHNCEHEERSPFRPFYHWALMPTVDAHPQDEQWMATYASADAVFAYSDWGLDVLRRQGGGKVKTVCSAPPGADTEVLSPVPDRRAHKRQLGLPEDSLVVGTVMRNQKRKLYPDLIHTFARFLAEAPRELARRTYLYLHTCYPDLGWDIPTLVKEAGVGGRTLFTYVCGNCGVSFPSFYMDAHAHCRACGQHRACLPNSHRGVDRPVLATVLNFFDVYVQYANSEGFGMPQVEAASCGVPTMAVDYSAMSDIVRKLKGTPVRVLALSREAETGCYRAVPDNDDFLAKLTSLLLLPDGVRLKRGYDARRAVLAHYTYDRTSKVWEDYFDSVEVLPPGLSWESPPRPHEPVRAVPGGLSDEEFVRWGMCNIAGRPDLADGHLALRMARDLAWGATLGNTPKSVFNEMSLLGQTHSPVDYFRQHDPSVAYHPSARFAADEMFEMCVNRNLWEARRADARTR